MGILLEAADINMSMLVPSNVCGLKRMMMPGWVLVSRQIDEGRREFSDSAPKI